MDCQQVFAKNFFNLPLILPAIFSAFIKTEPYSIRSTAL
jgi:hypothetical protein